MDIFHILKGLMMNNICSTLLLGTCLISTSALASRAVVHSYYPDFWNNNTQSHNNCYNYATNKRTNNFAQPGYASGDLGFQKNTFTCEAVMNGAIKDRGLELVTSSYDPDSNYNNNYRTLQALVISPGYDYHWYRRDKDGTWSHKPGQTSATNKDNSGHTIYNPETANRGKYGTFCGYFRSSSSAMGGGARRSNGYQGSGNVTISGVFNPSALKEMELLQSDISKNITKKSVVTVLTYSGRKNPTINLNKLSENTKFKLSEAVKLLKTNIYRPLSNESNEQYLPSKLGYSGILIEDHEGLYFDKGTSVLISDDEVKIKKPSKNLIKGLYRVEEKQNNFSKSYMLDITIEEDILDMAVTKGLISKKTLSN